MTKPKEQKCEEELEEWTVARREKYKYKRIKNDPELFAAEQGKRDKTTWKRRKVKKLKTLTK